MTKKIHTESYHMRNREKKCKKSRSYHQRIRDGIFAVLGRSCLRCGFEDDRALQIDHVNGGGSLEKKSSGNNFYKIVLEKVLNGSEDYQILCANCNWIKRVENREVRKIK